MPVSEFPFVAEKLIVVRGGNQASAMFAPSWCYLWIVWLYH